MIDLVSEMIITPIQDASLAGPEGIALSPDGAYLYATRTASGGTVLKISTATNTVVDTVALGTLPTDLVVTPDGQRLFVALPGDNTIRVFTTADMLFAVNIGTGAPVAQLAMTPDGSRIFAPQPASSMLSVIDATNEMAGHCHRHDGGVGLLGDRRDG